MSEELFEVAFQGQLMPGASLDDVKQRVAKMFNAGDAKLEQLFSGNRIIIKKNIDQATASKYQSALERAGALCDVRSMTTPQVDAIPATSAAAEPETVAVADSNTATEQDSGDILAPPQTDPLGIKGEQIADLEATVAPVGSELQSAIKEVPEPQYDLSEFDVAPVGSQIGIGKKQPDPPPPDTSGISMADD